VIIMKITKRTIKKISIISTVVAVIFFVISAIFYLTSPILDYLIVITLTIAVAPPSIAGIIHTRWKIQIEKATPNSSEISQHLHAQEYLYK